MLNKIIDWLSGPRYTVLTILLVIIAVFSGLSILDLRMEEPRRALVAMEMMDSGNYIVPTLNGEPYYNKPPVFNWMIILFFKLFGSFDEWVVRIPSVLGFLGIGLVNYVVVKKYINKHFALVSTLMVYTTGEFLYYSTIHSGEIDLFYSFIVICQAIAMFYYYDRKQYLALFMISYFLMAVGVLTKGIPSFAFQGITLLAMAFYYKDLKLLFRWQHFTGLVFAFALLTGYFYWYSKYEDVVPYLIKLFMETSEKSVVENFNGLSVLLNFIKFPFMVAAKTLPWSLLILVPLFAKKKFRQVPKNSLISFLILFTLTNIIIYWITPDVKFRYTYMFFPLIITTVAYYAYDHLQRFHEFKSFRLGIRIFHAVVIGILITVPFLKITSGLVLLNIFVPLLLLLVLLNWAYFNKFPQQFMLAAVVLLVTLRFVMNLTYLPLSRQFDFNFERFIHQTAEITRGEQVYFTGARRHYPHSLALGPLQVIRNDKTFSIPAFIRYKIPYYLYREKQTIMPYHEIPVKGHYYVAETEYYKQLQLEDAREYIISEDKKHQYVLFRLNE